MRKDIYVFAGLFAGWGSLSEVASKNFHLYQRIKMDDFWHKTQKFAFFRQFKRKSKYMTVFKMLHHVHHTALRCIDAAQTKWFWSEVLGLPAAAVKITEDPGTKKPCNYIHIFFELGDKNFIAFFDDPDTLQKEHSVKKHAFDFHIALEVDTMEEIKEWHNKLNQAGVQCLGPVNHDFVHSIYFFDPNGYQCEITVRDPDHDVILADEKMHTEETLRSWTAETREKKAAKVGAEALDARKTKFF